MFEAGQIARDDCPRNCQAGKPLAHRCKRYTHLFGNLQIEALTVFLQALQDFDHGSYPWKAHLLRLNPEELRQRAKAGTIPEAKVGRRRIFVEDDLVDHVRSLYALPRQALQVTLRKEMECHFANAAVSGGSMLPLPMGSEYAELLGLPVKP
jgi:hypothetical protein